MQCPCLKVYVAASGTWSVHTCTARITPYVPSLAEVNSYCNTSRAQSCIHSRRVRQQRAMAPLGDGALCAA